VDYVYDDASNIKEWNNDAAPARTRSFDYDELNRLESATSTGLWGNLSFTYDDLGNRLTQTWDGDVTTYVYDFSTNQLTGLTGAQLGAFTYDAVGRVKTEARNSAGDEIFSDGFESGTIDVWGSGVGPVGTLVYTFNNADQLEQVEEAGQLLGVYAYDGDGLRVSKTAAGETVYYFRDPSGNTIAEYDTAGELIVNYLYAGGRQVAKAEPDGASGYNISYFHPDHLGSAMVITDDDGVVTWQGDYRPFGEPVSSAGTADRYRFTGHELDTATDLTYAKARYYNARLGRFLSVDPMGGSTTSSQSWNQYAYVQNSPVTLLDPNGETVKEAILGFLQGVSGALSAGMLDVSQPSPNDTEDQTAGQVAGAALVAAVGINMTIEGAGATTVGGGLMLASPVTEGATLVPGAALTASGAAATVAGSALTAGSAVYFSKIAGNRGGHDARHKQQVEGDTQDLIDKEQEILDAYPDQPAGKTRQRMKQRMLEEAQDALDQGSGNGGS
jgi:RHS repeat-associated protein